MGVASQVAKFLDNSPKRQEALREKSMEQVQPSKKNHLLDLCQTRWVYRHTALEHFNDLYEVVVDVLDEMKHSKEGWNNDTIADASSLIAAIIKFDFVMGFIVLWKSLTLVKPLSISLQSSCIDICKAYRYVQQTKQSVQHIRDNADDFHLQWFELARAKSEAVGGDIPVRT